MTLQPSNGAPRIHFAKFQRSAPMNAFQSTTRRDRWVPWLVLAGGFLAGVGWVVGVVWLWSSHTWTRKEKIIATLLVPGGIALTLPWLVFSLATKTSDCVSAGGPSQPTVTHCVGHYGTSGALILAVLSVVPVMVAMNLEQIRRYRRPVTASQVKVDT